MKLFEITNTISDENASEFIISGRLAGKEIKGLKFIETVQDSMFAEEPSVSYGAEMEIDTEYGVRIEIKVELIYSYNYFKRKEHAWSIVHDDIYGWIGKKRAFEVNYKDIDYEFKDENWYEAIETLALFMKNDAEEMIKHKYITSPRGTPIEA